MSEWKTIEGFPDYSVNDLGDVKNNRYNRLVRQRQNQQGIAMVSIYRDGRMKTKAVGLIVADAFLPPPPNEYFNSVINLNGDRSDCRAVNLMRQPRPYAIRYFKMFQHEPFRVTVYVPETNMYFPSLRDFCTTYGVIESDAHRAILNHTNVSHFGWKIFRSKSEYEEYLQDDRERVFDERKTLYKKQFSNYVA